MHIQSKPNIFASATSPDATHESPGALRFQTAWRGTRVARRQTPLMLLFQQVSPGETIFTTKCHTLQYSTGFVAIAWRSNTTVRRYTNTWAVLFLSTQNKVK